MTDTDVLKEDFEKLKKALDELYSDLLYRTSVAGAEAMVYTREDTAFPAFFHYMDGKRSAYSDIARLLKMLMNKIPDYDSDIKNDE